VFDADYEIKLLVIKIVGKGRQHGHFKTSENVLFGYCFSTMKENGRVICFFRTFE
jgi:hypothetical protein